MPAMDDTKPDKGDNSESASPSYQDRILDRKIERRALTESFSSNLGRKAGSSSRNISDRSVRAMVCLFERSSGTSGTPSSRARADFDVGVKADKSDVKLDDSRNDNDKRTPIWSRQPQAQKDRQGSTIPTASFAFHGAQVGYQVEEYSLTLLKHKCYFNNRPLARCLDDYQEEEERKKSQQVPVEVEKGKKSTADDKKNARTKGQGEENKVTLASKQGKTPAPIQQLDELMNELLIWPGISGPRTPEPCPKHEDRDPAEVEGYWSNVRAHLWIDEDEMDRNEDRPIGNDGNDTASEDGDEVFTCHDTVDLDPEHLPPPVPTRPPPPVPTISRAPASRSPSRKNRHSAAPSVELFPDIDEDYPAWDQPPPTPSVRLSISAPGFLNIVKHLPDPYPEPELPASQFRPIESELRLSGPAADINHLRYPSGGSGAWVRPPTWRSPSIDRTSALPFVPPPSSPIPTTQDHHYHFSHPSRHGLQAHNHQASRASTSTSISANSAITISSDRSIYSRTPKTSVSSATTRSTRATSSTDLSGPRVGAQRRLTTEEKLSEIDAFLFDQENNHSCG